MLVGRRRFLHLVGGTLLLAALPRIAAAENYPSRPIRLIVGSAPGAAPDVVARLIAQYLSQRLGQAVVVENRNGASGNLATEMVARAVPDGYTLLLISASNAINTSFYQHLNFNFLHDIAPVGGVVAFPMVITVRPAFPAASLAELIAAAKARPGKINIGTPPIGSPQHVAGEFFKMQTGADIEFIAYAGGPQAITDALGGQIDGVVGTVLLLTDFIRSGKLRALAVTGTAPSPLLPGVPTVASVVPGFEASQWVGLGTPAGTPPDVITLLNAGMQAALADASFRQRLTDLGGAPLPGSAADFGAYVAAEAAKWRKVVKFAKLKPE
ncbi:MAG: tripartite tricarboxylate transporter substrate binding protein [Xanthobacteraceae bacterium]